MIDLHTHSNISDGLLTPTELVEHAANSGVRVLALTDHDDISGLAEARQIAEQHGIRLINGVEISVTWKKRTLHIVGLNINPADEALRAGLSAVRFSRLERARQMALGLEKAGIQGSFEAASAFAQQSILTRMHFARFLVETGVCKDTSEVFRKYLTAGKPGYVPHRWARLQDAVQWITEAGGIAVIAHPARYGFTPNEEYALFSEFKAHGGRGVEVITGSHSSQEAVRYAETALEFDLVASRGSDFHSPDESRIDLGTLPWLPGQLSPVWDALAHRIQ